MREKAAEWRSLAEKATECKRGSSVVNFDNVVKVLLGE
ncbi:BnaA09g30690D [Brassica napus]|nr:BnaA09g30690D [Brassica napus]